MSETPMPAHPTTKVARDLTEIEELHASLLDQAIHLANDRLMPGGHAMVALGGVGSPSVHEGRVETLESLWWADVLAERPDLSHLDDEDDTWEPPLQTLRFWSEQWRRETETDYELRGGYTVATEAAFIRSVLDYVWATEPAWDDFAADINRARRRMEALLHAGRNVSRSRVECDRCEDDPPRLLWLIGTEGDGSDDRWKCPRCKARYERDDMLRAHAKQLRRTDAAKFVDQADAIAVLKAQGRGERTIRRWLSPLIPKDECEECGWQQTHQEHPACVRWVGPGEGDQCGGMLRTVWVGDREAVVEAYCEIGSRKRFVWWPDVWRRHLSTQTRGRDTDRIA